MINLQFYGFKNFDSLEVNLDSRFDIDCRILIFMTPYLEYLGWMFIAE